MSKSFVHDTPDPNKDPDPSFEEVCRNIGELSDETKIVDFGCAYGNFAIEGLLKYRNEDLEGLEYIGVDIDKYKLSEAQGFPELAIFESKTGEKAQFINNFEYYKYEAVFVDIIVCSRTLHDIPLTELHNFFHNNLRILKKGGKFIIYDKGVISDYEDTNAVTWNKTDFDKLFHNTSIGVKYWPKFPREKKRKEIHLVLEKTDVSIPDKTHFLSLCPEIYESKKAAYKELLNDYNSKQETIGLNQTEIWQRSIATKQFACLTIQLEDFYEKWNVTREETAREMIREYCRIMEQKLEEKIYREYVYDSNLEGMSRETIKEEFSYVPTRRVYVEDHREGKVDKEMQEVHGHDFLDHRKIIFIGTGGVGKSLFMLELAKKLVADNKYSAEYLPFYIEAGKIRGSSEDDFLGLMRTVLKKAFNENHRESLDGFISYLRENNRLFPLIDGYDQIEPNHEDDLKDILTMTQYFLRTPCYITTRPYQSGDLREMMSGNDLKIIEIQPFSDDELRKKYFSHQKDHYIRGIINMLEKRMENEINLLRIPMLARLVKIMILRHEFREREEEDIKNRAWLFDRFIDFIVWDQIRKDRDQPRSREQKKQDYDKMLQEIGKLALETLKDGYIKNFPKRYSEPLFKDTFISTWTIMKKIEFVGHFGDYENRRSITEKTQSFRHQFFQEYFAAQRLFNLYKFYGTEGVKEMIRYVEGMKEYMPEVPVFLREIVVNEVRDTESDTESDEEFKFWQTALEAPGNEDWIRTYALQVRDYLGLDEAKEALKCLFAEEQKMIKQQMIDTAEKVKLKGIDIPMDTVLIPAGKFLRGSSDLAFLDIYNTLPARWIGYNTLPVRWIGIDYDYCIDTYPVTNEQYCKFLNKEKPDKKMLKEWIDLEGSLPRNKMCRIKKDGTTYKVKKGYENHPVTFISWNGADRYSKWVGKRLPTEAEYEKAARGLFGRTYPWGNEFDTKKCRTAESSKGDTTEVKSYSEGVSPYGCCHMVGNVWEWCSDLYREDFYKNCDSQNPECTEKDYEGRRERVIRGGSWLNYRFISRCAYRMKRYHDSRNYDLGFRCARTL